MAFTLHILGHIHEVLPPGAQNQVVEAPSGATVRQILTRAGVNPDLVMTVLVNGERQTKEYVPPAGATITCLSALAGG